jgi:hypothetical protein
MPQECKSDAIIECYRRAAEARRMADTAVDQSERTDFLEIEQRWLSLAYDYGVGSSDPDGGTMEVGRRKERA